MVSLNFRNVLVEPPKRFTLFALFSQARQTREPAHQRHLTQRQSQVPTLEPITHHPGHTRNNGSDKERFHTVATFRTSTHGPMLEKLPQVTWNWISQTSNAAQ